MKLKSIILELIIVAMGAGVCLPVSAQSVMQPGGWEVKMKISAKNPATGESHTLNESTSKVCLSKEFLAKDPYLNPSIDKEKMEQKNAKCAISDEKRTGNAATWKMTCQAADGSTVEMSIENNASATKMTSNIQQIVKKSGETVLVTIATDSSYIGECTNEMPKL